MSDDMIETGSPGFPPAWHPSRRTFLSKVARSAAAGWIGADLRPETPSVFPVPPRRTPRLPGFGRARSVIYLHLSGGPPQLDLFDWKPELKKRHFEPCPKELLEGRRFAFIKGVPKLLGSPFEFRQHGDSGAWVSSLLPEIAQVVDRLCFIKSLQTSEFNHAPAELHLLTGDRNPGAASIGSWASFALGSANPDLPAYVVLVSGGTDPTGGKSVWQSGFLPSIHSGVQLRAGADPVFYLLDGPEVTRSRRRLWMDALSKLNESEALASGDPESSERTAHYELGYRMQASIPEAVDLKRESQATLERYGVGGEGSTFASHCLMARRLVERGVRFVQLFDWGWDVHGTHDGDDLITMLPKKCREVDRPTAALIRDLEERGLLESTLLVFGGEFGRTPMNEARNGSVLLGRDHHPACTTVFLAGAGIRVGTSVGITDEFGNAVVESPFDVRDLQATLLHLLGQDPYTLSYLDRGLRQRLIGPAEGPKVRPEVLA